MQEMPLERNQNLQNSQFHRGPYPQNPLEAYTLGTCVSTFVVLKNTPYFSWKGVGISEHGIGHVTLKNISIITKNILTAHPSLADPS